MKFRIEQTLHSKISHWLLGTTKLSLLVNKLKCPARDKHSSLFDPSVRGRGKKFYNAETGKAEQINFEISKGLGASLGFLKLCVWYSQKILTKKLSIKFVIGRT